MLEWDERKRQEEEYKKIEHYRKLEDERLKKQVKQETAYKVFKDWLKQSLLKQRDEHIEKRYRDQEKREIEEREKKAAANKKIMARIAYKEWKERKLEEDRQRRKHDRMDRRDRLVGGNQFTSNAEAIEHLRRVNSQMNGGDVMLAYGLNKNLKKLKARGAAARPKSARPLKKQQQQKHYIP